MTSPANRLLFFLFIACAVLSSMPAGAQIDATLFRFPAVSQTQIVFTYANDLWIVAKEGGKAFRLSSPSGVETFPKFSPDGKTIAFTADYDGNNSIYTLPTEGGVPFRLTWHGNDERVVDWYPDGKALLFASSRQSGRARYDQFYKISPSGGTAQKLALPYGEFATFSPDGSRLALTFKTQVFRNWKRYRGGWNGAIHLFNLTSDSSENISTGTDADDELPMWHGGSIYFLSDRGPEVRMNLWRYDLSSKTFTQLTHFTDYDVHYPSLGPSDIVFENAGKLYLYDLKGNDKTADNYKEIHVQVVTDEMSLRPMLVGVEKYMHYASLAPDGKRVLIGARGDLFSLPAENGVVENLTQSSSVADRYPSWSPDGKTIAWWSDRSGEYELTIRPADARPGSSSEQQLTHYGPGFRYDPYWSPDGKKIAFIDKAMQIQIFDLDTRTTTLVDHGLRMDEGALERFSVSWSPDSRWMAYDRDMVNGHQSVFLYDYSGKTLHPVTSGFYSCFDPVFDRDGKYLFLLTNQHFSPLYSDLDNTFIYPNSTRIAAIVLKKTTPSPVYPKNDTVSVDAGEDHPDHPAGTKKHVIAPVDIDLDGLESRLVFLPVDPGNFLNLQAGEGKLIYQHQPNTGSAATEQSLDFYDLDKRKTKTIVPDITNYQLSADGKKLLVATKERSLYIIPVDENQKLEKKLRTSEMQMWVDPRGELKQILTDAWRLTRDYFYDPHMHGVDWNKVRERYMKMLEGAVTREDVDFIIGEMIGELNSSHTYHGGGDLEEIKHVAIGYLGVDWEAEGGFYKIKRIIRAAPWDADTRSSLDQPGVPIKEGDFILAVDGQPLTTSTEPYAAFRNLPVKTVELTYNSIPSWNGARKAIVQTLGNEGPLRFAAWIEEKRKRVDEATHGDVGYIYVQSTGIDGQDDLIRQFTAQFDKKALIIDERFNNGGQIPDRFIELLNRKPLAFFASRDGIPFQTPPAACFGPKVMLINGWSGSGGDAFPAYFRASGLGPLIGTRTWGGLIGISGVPGLIDGGAITVPTFRMFNPDGTWFHEGHGVDPDIEVPENLTQESKGIDNQLERAITEIQSLLKTKGYTAPKVPAYEVR